MAQPTTAPWTVWEVKAKDLPGSMTFTTGAALVMFWAPGTEAEARAALADILGVWVTMCADVPLERAWRTWGR